MRDPKDVLIDTILTIFTVSLFIFLLQSVFAHAATPKPEYNFSDPVYERTIDGDTIVVTIHCIHPIFGRSLSIRVRDVDAPETRTRNLIEKAKGLKAKAFTKNLMEGATDLRLKRCFKGTFSRIICDVSNSKTKDLARDLKKAGFNVKK